MAVSLEQATYGVDAGEVSNFLSDIKSNVIEKAANLASTNTTAIIEAVDNNWKGTAADAFKQALQEDADELKVELNDMYNELQNAINQVAASIVDFDNDMMSMFGKGD